MTDEPAVDEEALKATQRLIRLTALRGADVRAYSRAQNELDRFVALWPTSSAPEDPATYREVLAQGSRVRLALSPFL